MSIKALCIEGNSDSHYNFIDKVKMDRLLRSERLDTDPSSSTESKNWLHWLCTFENILTVLPREGLDRLLVLTNYVCSRIFEYIEHCLTYDEAIGVLKAQCVKPANEIFFRHLLATRRQKSGKTLDEFLRALKSLSKVCNFQNVAEIVYRDEAVRDARYYGTALKYHPPVVARK